MPRNISAALKAHLESEAATLVICVKLTRLDGTIFGFTGHDRDLTFGSVTYHANDAVTGSALKTQAGAGVDNLQIVGLLRSESISEDDVRAGRYDGATVEMMLVNWSDSSQGTLLLLSGVIGEISVQDGQYTAELRSLSQRLGQNVGDLTSPLCRVKRLGDADCGVNLTAYTRTATVAAVTDRGDFTVSSVSGSAPAAGYFSYGTVLFTSGANAGIEREIKQHTVPANHRLVLMEPFPFTVAAGDAVTVVAGCDRRLDTCRDRFSNVVNFQGEPHIPGFDRLYQVGGRT